MVSTDQSEVIEFLSQPSTHGTTTVDRIETHASVVFLVDDHAFKLKRAVRYDYLDFSSCQQRHRMCERELRLNQRTAPTLYERLVPVTREADGRLALGGRGAAVDWLLRMRRFEQDALLDRLAERGALPLSLMASLGETLARFHRTAAPRVDSGGLGAMARVIDGNARSLGGAAPDLIDRALVTPLIAAQTELLGQHGARIERRRQQGFVRHCHGDLHLGNLVLLDGVPTLFDGIEFNDDLACIDVAYDLAFLLMDLWRRRLPRHANGVLNAYLASTLDFDGLALLPLLLSCRATIRAKTSATTAAVVSDPSRRSAAIGLAHEYLELATALLRPAPCLLLAIGGRSGTGKSSVARVVAAALGPAPGAVVIRSDVVRKGLLGVSPDTRLDVASYTAERTERVYATVFDRCGAVATNGHAAIADAVFGRPDHRAAIRSCAAAAHLPFAGVWLDAPRDVLLARIAARTGDASDADAAVLTRQFQEVTPPDDWTRVDATGPLDAVVARVREIARQARIASATPPGPGRRTQEASSPIGRS